MLGEINALQGRDFLRLCSQALNSGLRISSDFIYLYVCLALLLCKGVVFFGFSHTGDHKVGKSARCMG